MERGTLIFEYYPSRKLNRSGADHETIGVRERIIEIDQAMRITGSRRFFFLRGMAAILEIVLAIQSLKHLLPLKFTPVFPPVLVRREILRLVGWADEQDIFSLKEVPDLTLVPTSEVSLLGLYMNKTIKAEDLPIRMVGFSTCFRREDRAKNKDTRGILRTHQFDKIEMVSIAYPDNSADELDLFLSIIKELLIGLELPFRIIRKKSKRSVCGNYEFDFEVWFPSQEKFRETHSICYCLDRQSSAMGIRYIEYRNNVIKTSYAHTLNGTYAAVGRLVAAILENHITEDGSIRWPPIVMEELKKLNIPID